MSVYELDPDSGNYDSLFLDSDVDSLDLLDRFDGRPLARSWTPVRVTLDARGRQGDFPSWSPIIPVFSERAWKLLRPLIGTSVEALPLAYNEAALFAINVTDVADCLDHARSSISRFSDGRVMWVDSHVFKGGCVGDRNIFKLPEHKGRVYVSERFKKAVEDAGLEGLIFRQVA